MDYEVVWNGSHRDFDQDLLCCDVRLEKRRPVWNPAEAEELPKWANRDERIALVDRAEVKVRAVLSSWKTFMQIRELADLSGWEVKSVLWRLNKLGLVESQPDPKRNNRAVRYRLRETKRKAA
jgi:hypothetical protein